MQNSSAANGRSVESRQWTGERLDSWKEVASFFRREVRTVQLWEKSEGLPVRRQHHKKLGSVYAYRHELEAWWVSRSNLRNGPGRSADLPGPARDAGRMNPAPAPPCRIAVRAFDAVHSPLDLAPARKLVERFADGLRSDVVHELVRLQFHPIVPAFANPHAPRNTPSDQAVCSSCDPQADFLLTGSVRCSETAVRVTVQLIRAADSVCMWSDRFDAPFENLLQSQARLAQRIGESIPIQPGARNRRHSHTPTDNRSLASNACKMGFHHWQRRGRAALMKAVSYFQDAIELDPRCAEAYAGLADTYVSLSYNHLMPAWKAATLAHKAVQSAVRIDRASLRVRNALINLLMHCTWDLKTAERNCRELLDQGNVDVRTLQLYSSLMNFCGRHQDAISLALHAWHLEPQSDLINGQASVAYFYAGDYSNALAYIGRTIELQPEYLMGYALLGRAEAELGNWATAIRAFERGMAIAPRSAFMKALLAWAQAGAGNIADAERLLDEIGSEQNDECFPAYDVSAVHAILGREEQALMTMHKAVGARDMKMMFVEHDPRFTRLRSTTGFREIASAIRTESAFLPSI